MIKQILLGVLFLFSNLFSQNIKTPLENSEFLKLTFYDELTKFIYQLNDLSDLLNVEVIGQSVEGRNLYALKFSKSEFGIHKTKLRVLFFAQQHGNEQSGKEGALLLARELLRDENKYLFDRIDFVLIPQVNPDGSEVDRRRNANGADLNRNHLILSEPETIALHKLFNKYLFEFTLDVHEYNPYSKSWEEFGFFKRADEQLGLTSNLNVSEKIRKYSKERVLPFVEDYLKLNGFSFCEYVIGGPPNIERLRHSTVDVNDGRQSLGILNSLSFILEGKNGRDSIDNIKHRVLSQSAAMMGLLKFAYENTNEIKSIVKDERKNTDWTGYPIVIKMDHFPDGSVFSLPVTNVITDADTVINVTNYHPLVKNLLQVPKPDAYLIPADDARLVDFLNKHDINYHQEIPKAISVQEYIITTVDSIEFEGEKIIEVKVDMLNRRLDDCGKKYIIVPTNQLKGNLITIAFEPQSILGLIQYKQYEYLKNQEKFPILRVIK